MYSGGGQRKSLNATSILLILHTRYWVCINTCAEILYWYTIQNSGRRCHAKCSASSFILQVNGVSLAPIRILVDKNVWSANCGCVKPTGTWPFPCPVLVTGVGWWGVNDGNIFRNLFANLLQPIYNRFVCFCNLFACIPDFPLFKEI